MIKKVLCFLVMMVVCLSLTGCSSFFDDGSEVLEISSIESITLEDGSTILRITYADEERLPDEFIIPKGAEGNGIKGINTVENDDGTITVTISFTDKTMEDEVFILKNGISVIGVESEFDSETGETLMKVKFSNGEYSEPIILPKGEKGEDGNSFTGYDIIQNEDLSMEIYFHFSKSDDVLITIPAPKEGAAGRGISSIISMETDTEYVLQINYDDETNEEVRFTKPADPNKWYNGGTEPDRSLGVSGDYYFDIFHNDIYVKEGSSWTKIVDFDADEQYCSVKFNLNDSDEFPAKMPSGSQKSYNILKGNYFSTEGYSIPIPTRDGYTFVGWYTSREISQVTGQLTEITPIFNDVTFYAIWEVSE